MRFAVNSQFFLDPEAWEMLGNEIIPAAVQAKSEFRAWSAGCYTGKEPFSLALLMAESQPHLHSRILATDRDRAVLGAAANGGPFHDRDIRTIPSDWRGRHLKMLPDGAFVQPAVRDLVEFQHHDLLSDPYPSGFALILYRNLEPFFSKEENLAIWQKLRDALSPGGVLFVGATDRPPSALNPPMTRIASCFFRRSE